MMPEVVAALAAGILAGVVLARSVGSRPHGQPVGADWDALVEELERARRYEYPFVLARLRDTATAPTGAPPAAPVQLRRTDRTWAVGPDRFVLLPESDRHAGLRWAARLWANGDGELDIRIASFPQDGLTTGALVASLDQALHREGADPIERRAS